MPLNLERNDATHRAVVQLYQLVEDYLLRHMGESVERLVDAPDWERMVTLEIMRLRREAQKAAGMIDSLLPRLSERAIEEALIIGATDAYSDIKAALGEEAAATASLSSAVNHAGMYALAGELQGDLAKLRHSVLRSADDMYRRTVQEATAKTVAGAQAIGGAWRDAAKQMARDGLTGFVDNSGRTWKLDTYAEMATRTATNRAHMMGHSQAMIDHGLDLIVVSSHRNPAPQCAPFEGKVLSLTGKHSGRSTMDNLVDGTTAIVNVKCSLDEALAKGFRHPNAILGDDQLIDMLGGAVAGSKGTYCGPAITIRTAKGNVATVSPEHPVLTGRGWVTAETVRVGDDVFNAASSHGAVAGSPIEPNNNDMVTTVHDAFRALEAVGTSSFIPTTGHNFDDDRRFLKEEVHVVETEHSLLPVLDTEIVKETGEVRFIRPDMELFGEVSDSAFEAGESVLRAAVFRALPDSDSDAVKFALNSCSGNAHDWGDVYAGQAGIVEPLGLVDVESLSAREAESGFYETMPACRAGDSEDPRAVLEGLSAFVETDKVVGVDFVHFSGHAFDFQTVDGVYALSSIIVHNCKHTWSAYVPGTRLPVPEPDPDHEGYKATQKQRYYERKIREWRRAEAVAVDKQYKDEARAKIRHYQQLAQQNADDNGLRRKKERESLR